VVVWREDIGLFLAVASVRVEVGTAWSWLGVILVLVDGPGVVIGEVVDPSEVLRFFRLGLMTGVSLRFEVSGWIGTLLGEGIGCIVIEVEVVGLTVGIGGWDGLDGLSMMMGLEFEPRTGEWGWELVMRITGGVGVAEMGGGVLGLDADWLGLFGSDEKL
jgi:hypothetical protein